MESNLSWGESSFSIPLSNCIPVKKDQNAMKSGDVLLSFIFIVRDRCFITRRHVRKALGWGLWLGFFARARRRLCARSGSCLFGGFRFGTFLMATIVGLLVGEGFLCHLKIITQKVDY
jgi:hypothetical protein